MNSTCKSWMAFLTFGKHQKSMKHTAVPSVWATFDTD